MEGKDEENITLRTPLEVYRDILEDEDSFGDMTEEQKQKLSLKASQLKEISPDCHCSQQGLKGKKIKSTSKSGNRSKNSRVQTGNSELSLRIKK